MSEHKVIFSIKQEGDAQTIGITFDPEVVGDENPDWETMTKTERRLQNIAVHVANEVMGALKS